MAENIFNNAFGSQLAKPFGMNVLPERTMQQVKESALGLVKDIVGPITDVGLGKEDIFNGEVARKINSYNNVVNMVMSMTAAADDKNHRTLDIKL